MKNISWNSMMFVFITTHSIQYGIYYHYKRIFDIIENIIENVCINNISTIIDIEQEYVNDLIFDIDKIP